MAAREPSRTRNFRLIAHWHMCQDPDIGGRLQPVPARFIGISERYAPCFYPRGGGRDLQRPSRDLAGRRTENHEHTKPSG
jgi:hypothetical protein